MNNKNTIVNTEEIDQTRFNWDKVSKKANLHRFTISDILNEVVDIHISVARNVYKDDIKNGINKWYKSFEKRSIPSLRRYLRYSTDEEKKVVYKEVKRYMKANIFYGMPSKKIK